MSNLIDFDLKKRKKKKKAKTLKIWTLMVMEEDIRQTTNIDSYGCHIGPH